MYCIWNGSGKRPPRNTRMYNIAQRYGIRLESLYDMNNLPADYAIQVNDRLRVR